MPARRTLWIGAVLLAVGAASMLLWYPLEEAAALGARVWPVLLFVVAMTVVAELASEAGLFDYGARQVLRRGGAHQVRLWLLVCALALLGTVFLSLDTTAVLLTPVVVALAARAGVSPLPYALVTLWLANTGSLLLPVSNLTNLLAQQRLGLGPLEFANLMWRPAVVGAVLPVLAVAYLCRRELRAPVRLGPTLADRSPVAHVHRHRRPLLLTSGIVVMLLVIALVSGVEVWIPACLAALALALAFARWRPEVLRPSLVPGPMIVLTAGMFLATSSLGHLLHGALDVVPPGDSLGQRLLLALSGAGLANAVNNLPAFLVMEPLAHGPLAHAALLVGVNAGPLLTPWGSLATLLWHDRLVRLGVEAPWRTVLGAGAVLAPVTVVLGVLVLG